MCHSLWITIFYSPSSPFFWNDFGCMLQEGVITSPTQIMQCFFWKIPSRFDDPKNESHLVRTPWKKPNRNNSWFRPSHHPLPIKILLPPQKKKPTILPHLPLSTAPHASTPRVHRRITASENGLEVRISVHFSKGRRRFFLAKSYGWLLLVALPGGFVSPKKPRLLDNTPGVYTWEHVCVGLDVAAGQQHMETSTFLLRESKKQTHQSTSVCLLKNLFCVWKNSILLRFFENWWISGGTPTVF